MRENRVARLKTGREMSEAKEDKRKQRKKKRDRWKERSGGKKTHAALTDTVLCINLSACLFPVAAAFNIDCQLIRLH